MRVLDSGLGFGDVDPDTLFMPFYRAPEAQQVANGVGLGLPVCDRIIRALGGRIWARARDGGGSEFGFAIPFASEPTSSDSSGSQATDDDGRPRPPAMTAREAPPPNQCRGHGWIVRPPHQRSMNGS